MHLDCARCKMQILQVKQHMYLYFCSRICRTKLGGSISLSLKVCFCCAVMILNPRTMRWRCRHGDSQIHKQYCGTGSIRHACGCGPEIVVVTGLCWRRLISLRNRSNDKIDVSVCEKLPQRELNGVWVSSNFLMIEGNEVWFFWVATITGSSTPYWEITDKTFFSMCE